ncbi:MAG TPA: hypothetical protein PLW67_02105 [Prolixibacteraceae bacterium]|nr:hypothetical protein [Prolixibacteraceae bacterium]
MEVKWNEGRMEDGTMERWNDGKWTAKWYNYGLILNQAAWRLDVMRRAVDAWLGRWSLQQ